MRWEKPEIFGVIRDATRSPDFKNSGLLRFPVTVVTRHVCNLLRVDRHKIVVIQDYVVSYLFAGDASHFVDGGCGNTCCAGHRRRYTCDLPATLCLECHGPDRREGGLRLTNRSNAFTPGDSGEPAIVAGRPDQSLLILRITDSGDSRMPPPDAGEGLTTVDVARRWIRDGAQWPTETPRASHWTWQKPRRLQLPRLRNTSWPNNPIDSFG